MKRDIWLQSTALTNLVYDDELHIRMYTHGIPQLHVQYIRTELHSVHLNHPTINDTTATIAQRKLEQKQSFHPCFYRATFLTIHHSYHGNEKEE